jgi:hypothetical protein
VVCAGRARSEEETDKRIGKKKQYRCPSTDQTVSLKDLEINTYISGMIIKEKDHT